MTRYRSKVDGWLAVVLGGAIAVALWASFTLLLAETPANWLSAALIALFGAVLPLWVLLRTIYTLDATHLHIRSGPFAWHIPVADITGITPTSNPLSSPALSLDRLRIDRRQGASVMISPRDKVGFLRDIAALRKPAEPGAAERR